MKDCVFCRQKTFRTKRGLCQRCYARGDAISFVTFGIGELSKRREYDDWLRREEGMQTVTEILEGRNAFD